MWQKWFEGITFAGISWIRKPTIYIYGFINLALSGNAPTEFAPYFASAPLVPVQKKDGSLRPIAVGGVLRRIVSKICVKKILHRAISYLSPVQLGVGIPNGIEAIVHGLN